MPSFKTTGFADYEEFWPYYLSEHSLPITRAFHYVGTMTALLIAFGGLAAGAPWMLLVGFVWGYVPAWTSHFFLEKNRPATFKYPGWSFRSDFRLLAYFLTGRIGGELQKWGIQPKTATAA